MECRGDDQAVDVRAKMISSGRFDDVPHPGRQRLGEFTSHHRRRIKSDIRRQLADEHRQINSALAPTVYGWPPLERNTKAAQSPAARLDVFCTGLNRFKQAGSNDDGILRVRDRAAIVGSRSRQSRPISATGFNVPTSLLASITDTSTVFD